MSQVTGALSINNGAASPVAKSFAPESVTPARSVFTERSAASSNGFIRLGVGFDPASSKRATNRISIDLAMPVIESVSGQNQVTRIGRFSGQFIVPDTMTAAERADLHAFAANALNVALIKAVVKDLDPMY